MEITAIQEAHRRIEDACQLARIYGLSTASIAEAVADEMLDEGLLTEEQYDEVVSS